MTLLDGLDEQNTFDETTSGSSPAGSPVHAGQWRLARVDVVNWGTFDGRHSAPVGREGHLITGSSGSGKSSLLDAIATVLTPRKWLRFNAAAQDAATRDHDRSLVSYVRGAWRRQTDEESGEAATDYLRKGATWSGILLRYENGLAAPVNLVRLFHLKRGDNTVAGLHEVHIIRTGDIDLLEFEELTRAGIEVRRMKQAWPDALVTDNHAAFANRFRRLFGIGSENALQLLHKTQAAKNLSSLDVLFRGYMLDRPPTFEMAERAVEQFRELDEAHRVVVEAREQADLLRQLHEPIARYEQGVLDGMEAVRLSESVDDYTDSRSLQWARHEHDQVRGQSAEAVEVERHASREVEAARAEHLSAQMRVREVGGDAIESERLRLHHADSQLIAIEQTREQWRKQLAAVGVAMPDTASDLEELRSTAHSERAELQSADESAKRREYSLHEGRTAAARRITEIDDELRLLKDRRSNMPPNLLDARALIAEHTGLPERVFPFVGELLEVASEFADWTGAIERVLRPLTTVMLVSDEHLPDVAHVVDREHLNARLQYESVPLTSPPPGSTRSRRSLVNRVIVSESDLVPSPMLRWLRHRLAERFDYECVDSVVELRAAPQAVTIAGQVKRGVRSFEKDDRYRIDDRRHWILGADNDVKVELLLAELAERRAEVARLTGALDQLGKQRNAARSRVTTLELMDSVTWSQLDANSARADIDRLRASLAEMQSGNRLLDDAIHAESTARERVDDADARRRKAQSTLDQLRARERALASTIGELAAKEPTWALPDDIAAELDRRFHAIARGQSRETLLESAKRIATDLKNEQISADRVVASARSEFEKLAGRFVERHRAMASELTVDIADRAGFLDLHDRIVSTGLPDYESKFFGLLKDQSRQQTGQLLQEIRSAVTQVDQRIEPVNASLRRSPFDEGRYLQIKVKERRSDEVREFMAELRSIAEGAWDDDEDRAIAERRFETLRSVMKRLGDSDQLAWQKRVLDTREHVTFVGIEEDENGAEMNRHDSGASLSGGQRQKLVIFCLAAALRFQLAEDEDDSPTYGTVILDEAFDKADSDFTRMTMDVFREFGFHMILATPMKLLQTLERYVDGVSFVVCLDHRDSRISAVPIEKLVAGAAGGVQ